MNPQEAFGLGYAAHRASTSPAAIHRRQARYGAKITYDLDLTRDGAVPVLGFSTAVEPTISSSIN